MERYVFTGKDDFEHANKTKDTKVKVTLMLTSTLLADAEANTLLLAKISFDIGTNGLLYQDIAQYFYDNYSEDQIIGLYGIAANLGPSLKMEKFESEEELAEIRKNISKSSE